MPGVCPFVPFSMSGDDDDDDERHIKTALTTIGDTEMLQEGIKLNPELSVKHMETCSGIM